MLSKCCWHVELEKMCIIDNNVLHEEVCGTSCPVCTGETTKLFLPINKVNLCRVLVKLFCESGKSDITPQNVAKYIIDTDNYELSVYGKKTKLVNVYHVHGTALQLIASGIIILKIKQVPTVRRSGDTEMTNRVICCLAVVDDINFAFSKDDKCTCINLI